MNTHLCDMEWLKTRAYLLEHGTNIKYQRARQLNNFPHFAMIALEEVVPRGHDGRESLDTIYSDLWAAYQIANMAKPILMEYITFGQWVMWYENNIFPVLNKKYAKGD